MLDVVVAGGGYVGLSVAVAIKQAAGHLNVQVVEAAPEDVWKKDVRASAIIAAATRMLDVFGIWNEIEPEPADPQDDRHRFEDRRSGSPGVFDIRRRGGGGQALRSYGAECRDGGCAARPV